MATATVLLLLCTGFALAVIAAVSAIAAHRAATRAEHEAASLRVMRGRVIALEHGLEGMESRVKRVLGTVYEARSHARATRRAAETSTFEFDRTPPPDEDDGELSAYLELQAAPPAKPQ